MPKDPAAVKLGRRGGLANAGIPKPKSAENGKLGGRPKKAASRANVQKAREVKAAKRDICPHGLTDSRQCGECAIERRHVMLTGNCPHGLNDPNQCGECCVEAGF